jgi:hypothetical protein
MIKRSSWFVGNRHTAERANLLESPSKNIKTVIRIQLGFNLQITNSWNYKDFEFWV